MHLKRGPVQYFVTLFPWAIVGVGCWLGYQLVRQNGRILIRLDALENRLAAFAAVPAPTAQPKPGLPIGSAAPEFELPALRGDKTSLRQFRGKKTLLIFFNPQCGFCTQMAPQIAALPTKGNEGHPIPLLVTTGDARENRALLKKHGIRCHVLLQADMKVASLYQVAGTPMGYLLDEQGKIASEMAVGAERLLALASTPTGEATSQEHGAAANGNGHGVYKGNRPLAESHINRNGLKAGTPAPGFQLPRVDGGELSLEEYWGRKLLLVFSDPDCGPCNQLASRLEQAHRVHTDIEILMVSRGEIEANRAKISEYSFSFPVVLQKQWEISRLYGMFATPIAYRIDEQGMIAQDVATGVDSILALLSGTVIASNKSQAVPRS